MSDEAFIDSGAFIAFLDRSDRSHEDAVALFASPPRRWCTSAFVVSETYSWFLHRLGEEAARTFRLLLAELPRLTILDGSRPHRDAVARKLDALRGRKLTYVDASSLVWLAERDIEVVWGTDHHLGLEGARIVPGAPAR
ncbi:MAG: PIN domain-containing protein [Sandaracinaceae bacterium]|nr:PIN domain-containing protein [Sandaracinaceae bacterium]